MLTKPLSCRAPLAHESTHPKGRFRPPKEVRFTSGARFSSGKFSHMDRINVRYPGIKRKKEKIRLTNLEKVMLCGERGDKVSLTVTPRLSCDQWCTVVINCVSESSEWSCFQTKKGFFFYFFPNKMDSHKK
jgi:hypothetical protein